MNYVANPLIYSRPMTACAVFRLHSYILLNPLYSLNSIFPEIWKPVPSVSREDYTTMIIPSGNMHDGMVYDSCSLEKINISGYRKRYGNQIDCALLVTSDHMSPVYHTNDILLIARDPIRDGDTGIFINKVTGLLYIRRLRQTDPWRLEPLTYYGQTFYIDSNNASEMSHWIIFGHVISKTRG